MSRRDKGCCAAASASGTAPCLLPLLTWTDLCMDGWEQKMMRAQCSLHSRHLSLQLWSWKSEEFVLKPRCSYPFQIYCRFSEVNYQSSSGSLAASSKLFFPCFAFQAWGLRYFQNIAARQRLFLGHRPQFQPAKRKHLKSQWFRWNLCFCFKRALTIKIGYSVAHTTLGWAIIALSMLQCIDVSCILLSVLKRGW